MSMIGFPLLLIPLAVVNIVVFLMGLSLDRLKDPVVTVGLPSLQNWTITFSDLLLAFGLFLLMLEVVKSARPGSKFVTDHLLSILVFAGFAAEFAMLPQFANATFFLLAVMALVDVISGIWIRAVRPKMVAARAVVAEEPRPVSRPVAEPPPVPKAVPERVEPASPEVSQVVEHRDAPLAANQDVLPPEQPTRH